MQVLNKELLLLLFEKWHDVGELIYTILNHSKSERNFTKYQSILQAHNVRLGANNDFPFSQH